MDPATAAALSPPRARLAATTVAAALLAGRLLDAQAAVGSSGAARATALASVALCAWLPTLLDHAVRRRGGRSEWHGAARGAQAALLASALLFALGALARLLLSQRESLLAARAPWPCEPLAATAALLLTVALLPFPATAGAALLERALRRSRPQLVAARLVGRVGGALWMPAAAALALLPGGGRDPWAWLLAGAYALVAALEQRGHARAALAREWALQHDGAFQLPEARALAPAQFAPFAASAAAAYAARGDARMKQAPPRSSASSSSATDPA